MEKRMVQKLGLLCASVALCSAASWWSGNEAAEQQVLKLAEQPIAGKVREIKITVCVSGAVAKPGLYEVTKGSRAHQVIGLAGGMTEDADPDRVNLAQLCKDGGHIKVPRLSKARQKQKMQERELISDTGTVTVHLNSATEAELVRLPGVGNAMARRIISFRNRNGFQRIEDLMKIPGIGAAKFAKMKPYLVL